MNRSIKVVHIVAGNLDGGAARGAYWLHKGLLQLGVDSWVLTDSELTFGDRKVISTTVTKGDKLKRIVRENLDYVLTFPYRKRTNDLFSTACFGAGLQNNSTLMEADIVHLHWINNGFFNLKILGKIQVPLVWTIRDMWPMTGGCHFADAIGCDHYLGGCGNCKLLGSKRKADLSGRVFKRKEKLYPENIHPVGISNWMTQKANESSLFKGHKAITIFNNIDTEIFVAVQQNLAREILRLETKKHIILCGATRLNLSYKGFDKFLESLKSLDREKYFLAFFGKLDAGTIHDTGFEYRDFGYLHDDVSLRLLYSAADVFVAPSIMEPFGKTLGEAMACETPVACFDATGPKDIVEHKENGYRAKPFEPEDLAKGIEWIIENNGENSLGKSARARVISNFSVDVVAARYLELYKSLFA
ncbi:MAG: glycosyltransferase family 4 protein [Draconibacterium sp.]